MPSRESQCHPGTPRTTMTAIISKCDSTRGWHTFCRAMLCISAACQHMRCLSVRPSPSSSCILSIGLRINSLLTTNKHIFKNFFYHDHSTFSIPNVMAIFRRDRPQRKRRIQVGCRQKSLFSTNIWLHRVLSTVRPPSYIHSCARPCRVDDTHHW